MAKILLPVALLLATPAQAEPCVGAETGTTGTIEIVEYRLAQDVNAEEFARAVRATMPFLCARKGFLRRTLSEGADGV